MMTLVRAGCIVLSVAVWQLIWYHVLWRRLSHEDRVMRRELNGCSYRLGNGLAVLLGLCLADWLLSMLRHE